MTVGLLIITHNDIGHQLLDTANVMLGAAPLKAIDMAVLPDCDLDQSIEQAGNLIEELNSGDGVLILTDMYGSTPSNIANRFIQDHSVTVITGVNLPMLIRVLNYPRLNLEQLAEKARSGGNDGIMICKAK